METFDAEVLDATLKYMDKVGKVASPSSSGSTPPPRTSGRTRSRSISRWPWTKAAPNPTSSREDDRA